jgi:hypothetical protein
MMTMMTISTTSTNDLCVTADAGLLRLRLPPLFVFEPLIH